MAVVISGVNNNDKITATDGSLDLLSVANFSSEVTVPSFKVGSNIQLGNAGVATATTFVGNLTGNVNATSNLLLQIGGSEKFRVASSGQLGIGGANYGTSGQVLTSGGSGSAASWTTITGTTINNNASTKFITGTNNANELDCEANLSYNNSLVTFSNSGLMVDKSTNATISVKETAGNKEAQFRANTYGGILRTAGDYPLIFGTNQTERLRIHEDGWFMLNTSTLGSSKTAKELIVSYNNNGISGGDQGRAGMTIRSGQNTSNVSQSGYIYFSDGTSGTNESIGSIKYDHSDDNMNFATNGYERLRITSAGNLKMPDAAEIQLGNDTQTATGDLRLFHNGSNSGIINSQGALYIQNTATNSSDLHLQGKSSIQFHCPSDGTVPFKIDTSGWTYHNTTYNGTTNGVVDKRYNWGSGNNLNFGMHCTTRQRFSIWEHRQIGRTNERTAQMSCGENGSNQGIVYMYSSTANADVTGGVNLVNGATSWSATSDMRLKNKTEDILNALEDINKIEPIRFTWKYGPDNNPHVGVSAQSVENVVPEAIERGVDVERQREGDETEYMQVRYTELIPLSIAAIKELKAEVESLKAKVSALEGS